MESKPLVSRIDVDYPYPSRAKSFLYTFLGWKTNNQYLKYSKILADLINTANVEVKAFWFFNKNALPDNELLAILSSSRHMIGLHAVNDPVEELAQLESISPKCIEYYTIHGTSRLLGQIIWHRKLGQKQVDIPVGFKLKSFHTLPTYCLDEFCYRLSSEVALKAINHFIDKENAVVELHPEWLVCRGRLNHRGPYMETLSRLLHIPPVDAKEANKAFKR